MPNLKEPLHQSIIEGLYTQYYTKLLAFICSKISNKEDAKDILSEVFLKIHQNIHTLDSHEKITSWIYTITRHAIIDFYRKSHHHNHCTPFHEDIFKEEEDQDIKETLSKCLVPIINTLSPKYSHILQLSEIQRMKQQEIATHFHLSLSNVKSIVSRGKKKIKDKLFECCSYEYDTLGNVTDFHRNDKKCNFC